MNLLLETQAAPGWLRELAAARSRYEERLGWPVWVHVERKCLVAAAGGWLDAVSMPPALGEEVLARLRTMMQAAPVACGPDSDRWAFLTRPRAGALTDLPEDVRHLGAHLTPRGAHVVIPTELAAGIDGVVRWIEAPRPGQGLPLCSVITGATRRVTAELLTA